VGIIQRNSFFNDPNNSPKSLSQKINLIDWFTEVDKIPIRNLKENNDRANYKNDARKINGKSLDQFYFLYCKNLKRTKIKTLKNGQRLIEGIL
jgi:hypothetical protein